MKRIWIVAFVALLVWNLVLTIRVFNTTTVGVDNRTVIQNTVNGYDTDITSTVDETKESLVTVSDENRKASGVIYAQEEDTTYIMTCLSGLTKGSSVNVRFDNGIRFEGTVVGTDPATSLSLIATKPSFNVSIIKEGDSSLVSTGEFVIGLGARRDNESAMVTYGVESSIAQMRVGTESPWISNIIETDMMISNDNIGGALLNHSGELLGILISRPSEGQYEMSYAVAINEVRQVFNELKSEGTVTRGCLGVVGKSISSLRSYEKNAYGIQLDRTSGILVKRVYANSASDEAIQVSDLITAIDGKTLLGMEDLRTELYNRAAGDTVNITLLRDQEEVTVSVVLQ